MRRFSGYYCELEQPGGLRHDAECLINLLGYRVTAGHFRLELRVIEA